MADNAPGAQTTRHMPSSGSLLPEVLPLPHTEGDEVMLGEMNCGIFLLARIRGNDRTAII